MLIARLKETDVSDAITRRELSEMFKPDRPIEIVGLLHDRKGWDEEEESRYPDLYLAKKHMKGRDNMYAVLNDVEDEVQQRLAKYTSYDGIPVSMHAGKAKRFIWVTKEEVDVHIPPSVVAKMSLEKWDD